MKILITSDWYQPVVNGVVTSVTNLTDSLRAMGHEVRILTLSNTLHSFRRGEVSFLGSVGVGLIYPQARFRAAGGEALIRELIDWQPDIVHSQCEFSTFPFARRIARACGCPLVHTCHTLYGALTHYFSPSVRLGRFLADQFSRHILSQTDAVIAPTEKVRRALLRCGVVQPICTVPTGLKPDAFLAPQPAGAREQLRTDLGLSRSDLVLVYVGRLAQEKNLNELLTLLRTAAPPQARLLLAGDGPCRSELEAAAAAPELAGRVIFAGMIPPERIADVYRAGDVFVCASQSETQGLTYLEAMASGLPLLCRRDDCLAGVTGFAYDTPEDFAAGLQALSDPVLRSRFGAAARQTVQARFTADAFARAVAAVYRRCLAAAEGSAA